ncbi:MAG: hypothetical protein M1839_001053 [Geoglossum umbratile]|nr:MAG: hypothetical protein M1839_001053 [Geoglossum umbratile]
MASPSLRNANLQARYKSPNAEKIFDRDLGGPRDKATEQSAAPTEQSPAVEKTAYLATLRLLVAKLQEDVNIFLTQKMDEDKATAATGIVDMGKGKTEVDDEQEEENYGEEVVNEDD